MLNHGEPTHSIADRKQLSGAFVRVLDQCLSICACWMRKQLESIGASSCVQSLGWILTGMTSHEAVG